MRVVARLGFSIVLHAHLMLSLFQFVSAQSSSSCFTGTPGTRTIGNITTTTITGSDGVTTIIVPLYVTSFNDYIQCSTFTFSSPPTTSTTSSSTTSAPKFTITTTSTVGSSLTTVTTTNGNTAVVIVQTPTPVTVTSTKAQTFTTTFTTTGAANAQPTIEVDLPCRTPGLRAAFYNNPYRRSDIQTPYPNFDPSYFPPLGSGSGLLAFVRYNGDIIFTVQSNISVPVYGVNITLNYKAIQVEAYVYSPIAQTIALHASNDDIAFGYIGQKALFGPFTRDSADEFEISGTQGTIGSTRNDTFAGIAVAAGSFTPIRLINGFDLFTAGSPGVYNTAIVNTRMVLNGTLTRANYTLYSDVCPGDAANFPDNAQ